MENLSLAKNLFLRALAAQEAGNLPEAETLLRQALTHAPGRESLQVNLAGILLENSQTAEATSLCEQVLAHNPANPTAWLNLALCRMKDDAPSAALDAMEKSIALDPGNASAYGNQGSILMLLAKPGKALSAYEHAIRLDADNPEWHTARGTALRALRRFNEAAEAHTKALLLDPDCANAHWNRALVELTLGHYETGWQEFEWRWRTPEPVIFSYRGHAPRWHGASLKGQRILLWSEQGLGDTLQFCRFALPLAEQGAIVILQVQASLLRLLRDSLASAHISVIAQNEIPPPHDLHSPLLSLPRILGTRPETIPARHQAYLSAPTGLEHDWQTKPDLQRQPRVGLMWQGNLENRIGRSRSLHAKQLLPLLSLPCDFVFVGKDLAEEDAQLLVSTGNFRHLTRAISDFADTASLICQLDLVISIDTSVAHLAAALGTPTWVLLAQGADWRWGLDEDSSPWYRHSTRLFRQTEAGNWDEVISALRSALNSLT
ncbi:tetratricopeptide repeat protein [Uliginosibacterium flavum]|uniref:Tetratricopeptide repeat protein n=1 Tax=Uliginosibacterium flavum TaxID=1396831 RepID=A0ABV2TMB8_9RHOO